MRLSLLPMYSKLHESSKEELCAVGLEKCNECILKNAFPAATHSCPLSAHQMETVKAIRSKDIDVIVNTAMTGDGKSLAAYLPVLLYNQHAFGMYPTIELSRDQAHQFENYKKRLNSDVNHESLWGSKITALAKKEDSPKRRADLIIEYFKNCGVILTNPDIFNLCMNYRYKSFTYSDQELPYSLSINFDYFVFDEFHVFSMPQIVSALNAVLYIYEYLPSNRPKPKVIFSSATTNPIILDMIARSGLRYKLIEGEYSFKENPKYRPVLHPATLHIHQLQGSVEDWVKSNVKLIIDFWGNNSSRRAKGAIIVNSVTVARHIARFLEEKLKSLGITVGENTGLTDEERRKVSLQKDIVVGTSTIDVGVDFNINFLIFESINAGTFLQRLGRLGRYKLGETSFDTYEAHAIISSKTPWIYERIELNLREKGINDEDEIDRLTFREIITKSFPVENDFFSYARRWGTLQGAHVVYVLNNPKSNLAYKSTAEALEKRYASFFNLNNFKGAIKNYSVLKEKEQDGMDILDEVISFRGGSPFQVGIWDSTVNPNAFLLYDVFPIVQSSIFRIILEDEFKDALRRNLGEKEFEVRFEEFKHVMCGKGDSRLFLQVKEFLEEKEKLLLRTPEDLVYFSDRVSVLKGFYIEEPRVCNDITKVNEVLRRQKVVCYSTRESVQELRRKLRLPAMFPLYRLKDVNGKEYTVVFSKAALMLESLLLRFKGKKEENEPIIV